MIPRLPLSLLAASLLSLAHPAGGAAQGAPPGFREEFLGQFDSSMERFIALARAMPEDRFAWSPGPGVMPVGHVYSHVARYNFLYPAQNMGFAAPAGIGVDTLENVRTKREVVALLERSRDHVRQLAQGATEERLRQPTRLYGRDVQQWAVLLQLLAHMNEHLGQSVAYARMNGVVPPWSR